MDPNLPGRKVFGEAVIAPDTTEDLYGWFQGTSFAGIFDGDGHTISADRRKMGELVAARWVTALAVLTAAVLIVLNMKLLYDQIFG